MKTIKGSIFNSNADVIVNPVNCVGVMGAGLAKQFKIKYPFNFSAYKQYCLEEEFNAGDVYVYTRRAISEDKPSKYIFNAATKQHFKEKSKYVYVIKCLRNISEEALNLDVKSIALPLLGCGLGGLDTELVTALIEAQTNKLPFETELYVV